MGIMDRLSTLVRANVNDLLDKAEDPEKMIDQILRDMETNIGQARQQVAAMIAQEKELQADYDETTKLASEWGAKAQRAVAAGKDDLAREALRRKRDNEQNAGVYQQQLAVQEQTVSKLKDQLRQLESKYQATMSQRDSFLARARRARAQEQVARTLTTFSPVDPSADLERMERKIRGTEAKAAAMVEMGDESFDTQFSELDYDADVEAELAALKGESPAPAALGGGGDNATANQTAGTSTAATGSGS
ncbi:MAG: phage shock protein [Thermomicrobiales bacterium]|jgi:phage shock protein A|nr:phage shock protein [Thermomicrobiales bacterium]